MRRQRPDPEPPRFRITLACGHTIGAHGRPWNPNTRYVCRAMQGCGYQVGWTGWSCDGGAMSGVNPGLVAAVDPPPGRPI